MVAAVSFGVNLFSDRPQKFLEAFTIVIALVFATSIQTVCDWGKEQQFRRLQRVIQDEKSTVTRGQSGLAQQVPVSQLVVGDIVHLEAGDRVPADCILIEEMDMQVD